MKLILSFAVVVFSGCATIKDGSKQSVTISSHPEGAPILRDGQFVGTTPAYVDLERSGRERVQLRGSHGLVNVPVERHYGWARSFWSGFIWYVGAPISWGVDLITGAAFDLRPLPIMDVSLKSAAPMPPSVIVIAPPKAAEVTISDAAGVAIEASLRSRYPRAKIIAYKNSLPTFLDYGADFDSAPTEAGRIAMFKQLGATRVFESEVHARGESLVASTTGEDIFERKRGESFDVTLNVAAGVNRAFVLGLWSRILPNWFALEFGSTHLKLGEDGHNYTLDVSPNESVLSRALEYLSAVKISSLPARRLERSWHPSINFIPSVRASRRISVAPELTPAPGQDQNQTYTRLLAAIGFGPELGLQYGQHYMYLDILPMVAFSRIDWKDLDGPEVTYHTSLQFGSEVGYIYYLTQNWNVRVFTRTQNEDSKVWQNALADRLSRSAISSASVSNVLTGLSLGYRFEPRVSR